MVKRSIAEISKNQNIKLNTIQRNEILSGKNQEKERFSQLRKQLESEQYEGKLARKMRVHEGQRRLREKIEKIESLKGSMRREHYQSRVSLNQSRIEQVSEKIVQLVRQESQLIDRLTDTQGEELKAVQQLQKVISTSKIKINNRQESATARGKIKNQTFAESQFLSD